MTEATTTPASPATLAVSRRRLLQIGAASGAAAGLATVSGMLVPGLGARGLWSPDGVFGAASIAMADTLYTEAFPTSPLVLDPFSDELPIPKPLAPCAVDPTGATAVMEGGIAPAKDRQNSYADPKQGANTHQLWQGEINYKWNRSYPVCYQIDMKVSTHSFTTKKVLPINSAGQPTTSYDKSGKVYPAGTERDLPPSTIYGFNGQFPGPMINAEYGSPVVVRMCNHLDENPDNLPRQDFGTPDFSANIHLHNGHTAPESDGNPNFTMNHFGAVSSTHPDRHGYSPKTWVDNLYLNWPAGGDPSEKQSFFWFHDHRMDFTGSNVYKGLVGLYPIYDPELDNGDETDSSKLQLPGRRTNNADGSFKVDYDIPLAFFDARLDDGVTPHHDMHDADFQDAANKTHPEWWGMTFFKHFPNHGFVGDLFTVNGTANPVMKVKRRKYRFRMLDCSIARIYDFKLMASTSNKPVAAKDLGYKDVDLQGQYRLPDAQQAMRFLQVAADGGLLPEVIERDSVELWPAKRREVVIDFTKWMDGQPTKVGDVVWLVNTMRMPDGRMWSNSSRFSPDPKYLVPMIKFVIDAEDDKASPDKSVVFKGKKLRPLPPLPGASTLQAMMKDRKVFEVQRGSGGGEVEWLINGTPFDPSVVTRSLKNPAGNTPLAQQPRGSDAVWEIRNGGGGWVHPFHLHMEEHRTVMRNGKMMVDSAGKQIFDPGHPDDAAREDLAALDPSESVLIYRKFRDFKGKYVAHCHNLAHEDHAMMFGWEIT